MMSLPSDSGGPAAAHPPRMPHARDLLAFAVYIKSACPLRAQHIAEIPKDVYDALPLAVFQEVFSDILIETQSDIDQWLTIQIAHSQHFRLRKKRDDHVDLPLV
jgi:hypothetical protein